MVVALPKSDLAKWDRGGAVAAVVDGVRRPGPNAVTLAGVPLPARPILKPALRQVWRDPFTLQLGLEPRRAVVLAGLQPPDSSLFDLLDGSRDIRTLFTDAGELGCPPDRAVRLIELLASADALDDAPPADPRLAPDLLSLSLLHPGPGAAARVLARRRAATVAVHGAGRVGAGVVTLLAAAGVGRVCVDDDGPVRPADLGPVGIREQGAATRASAVVAPLRRKSPAQSVTTVGAERADISVVAPVTSVAPPEVLAAVRHRPHLLVTVRETTASVGPFVTPGRTPCLRCVHLARADRDPQWAGMTAQLTGAARGVEACDVVLATIASALAATQVLSRVDVAGGQPSTTGGVLELDLADGRLRRRSVTAHPSCGCGAADDGATMEE
jgi:bacteriocin biosynthesis cyclodehydratase domain-containing protein